MTEDWKIWHNAANTQHFTHQSLAREAFTQWWNHTHYTLPNDLNAAQYNECLTLKQKYHSSQITGCYKTNYNYEPLNKYSIHLCQQKTNLHFAWI